LNNILIKFANSKDAKEVWKWRNDITTRSMFVTSNYINWNSHLKWYQKVLANKNIYFFVGWVKNKKIGTTRFDCYNNKKIAKVSINLNPEMRNKKLSHKFLLKSMKKFRKYSKFNLTAKIKKNNFASIKCFTKCGFNFRRSYKMYYYYLLNVEK